MSLTPKGLQDLAEAQIQRYAAGFIHLSSEEVSDCWSYELIFTDISRFDNPATTEH